MTTDINLSLFIGIKILVLYRIDHEAGHYSYISSNTCLPMSFSLNFTLCLLIIINNQSSQIIKVIVDAESLLAGWDDILTGSSSIGTYKKSS